MSQPCSRATSAAFDRKCTISSTAQIEVFLFRKGYEGVGKRDAFPTEMATRGPNSGLQFLRIQTPCWPRAESFYRRAEGLLSFSPRWVRPPGTSKGNSRRPRERGRWAKPWSFSLHGAQATGWALAGPRRWPRRRPFPHHPFPRLGESPSLLRGTLSPGSAAVLGFTV